MPRGVGSGKDELSAGLAIEAITDDSALDALCQELRTIFDAHSHQIMTFGGQPAGAVLHNTTFPSDALRAYEAYYASKDLWALEVMRRPLPGVFVSQELVPDSAIAESEIHEDFGRNFFLDIRHMICVIHPIAPLRYMCISMHRSKSGEPFSRLSKSKLVSLAPILSATLGARSVFADLKLRAGLGFSALDAIGKPVMVVDRNACGSLIALRTSSKSRLAGPSFMRRKGMDYWVCVLAMLACPCAMPSPQSPMVVAQARRLSFMLATAKCLQPSCRFPHQ